jgi:hypothetical protein
MSTQETAPEATITQIAPGVRQVSVGAPFRSHVYLIDGPDGRSRSMPRSRAPARRSSPPRAGGLSA